MKTLLAGSLLLVLGLPPILSLIASYYLQYHFIDNFAADVQIKQFEYTHGWVNSEATIEFYLGDQNTVIRTQNKIAHGPVIWSVLTTKPLTAFSLYHINSLFEFNDNADLLADSSEKGTATTRVSFTGKISPEINHPGLTLGLFQSQVFADLPTLRSELFADGAIMTKLSANQLDIKDRYRDIYAVKPAAEISFESGSTLPSQLKANALNLTGSFGPDKFSAADFDFNSTIEKTDTRYRLKGEVTAGQISFNKAAVHQTTLNITVSDLDEDLMAYFSANYHELSGALQNNQWLVLLKHFSQIIKRLDHHQPQIKIQASGLHANQPVTIHFFGKLATDKQSRLNPFSILENLEMKLDVDIPTRLIEDINRSELTEFLTLMSDNGLLINKNESYHSKLTFQGAKLEIAHDFL